MENDIRVAWAAGLLEGEGCFRTKTNGYSAMVYCQMTDEDVVKGLADIFDGGSLTSFDSKHVHHKPTWIWCVQGDKAAAIMEQILPYMFSRRRAKIEEVLAVHYERKSAVARSKQATVDFHKKLALEYHSGGGSYREIARKYNVSHEMVRRSANKYMAL